MLKNARAAASAIIVLLSAIYAARGYATVRHVCLSVRLWLSGVVIT